MSVNVDAGLPHLLYVGDVPVEASHHGSALLHRMLEGYPNERLRVIECGRPSQQARRLAGVRYIELPIGRQRLLNSRFHGLYSGWLSLTATARVSSVLAQLGDFRPTAVVTVCHGYGWLLAAELAQRIGSPLHLIVHDDWPRHSGVTPWAQGWLERRFARVYAQARTRLCVSPFMADEFAKRYGVPGGVLYPFRSSGCPVFPAKPPRAPVGRDQIVIGYGGNSGADVAAGLKDLAGALGSLNARVVVFGPFGEHERRELLAISPAFTFHGLVPYQQMIHGLRNEADVLFVPMAFAAAVRDNMIVSFPSKLTDYTAIGLPLLVYGPPYCSAVRWARMHAPVAEIVDREGAAALGEAVRRIMNDPGRQRELSGREEDVVNVDPHPGAQARKNLEQQSTHVAAKLHRVTRIDEQDVAGSERIKALDRQVLEILLDEGDERQAWRQALFRVRLNTGELAATTLGLIALQRQQRNARRKPRPDLDHPRRFQVANERVVQRRVETREILVLEVESAGACRRGVQPLQLAAIPCTETAVERQL